MPESTIVSGPSVSVLLRDPLTHAQLIETNRWLEQVCVEVTGHIGNWIVRMDGATIGCQAGEEQCPIELEVIGPGPGRFGLEVLTGLDKNSFQANFGQIPTQEISIVAMCNRDIDHCLIARLALHFGKYYDGLINMTGAIIPWERLPGQYSPEEVKDFLLGIGGTRWRTDTTQARIRSTTTCRRGLPSTVTCPNPPPCLHAVAPTQRPRRRPTDGRRRNSCCASQRRSCSPKDG
jgi:hypothetical protein